MAEYFAVRHSLDSDSALIELAYFLRVSAESENNWGEGGYSLLADWLDDVATPVMEKVAEILNVKLM